MATLTLSSEQCQALLDVLLQKHGDEVIANEMYHKFVRLLTTNNLASGVFDHFSASFLSWPEANLLAETGATIAHFHRSKGGIN